MEMFSHLWGIVGLGRSTVVVEFHPPVTIRDFADRKRLAAYCQAVVAAGVSSALSGHPQPRPDLPGGARAPGSQATPGSRAAPEGQPAPA
jgi:1-acyl-sn-glycerol-3-phosphate acyltransferase